MPRTELITYKEKSGDVPLLRWLDSLPRKVQDKWTARLERLEELGHELRRPECDILRDEIYELRLKIGTVQYRILYTFIGRNVVLLSHGCTKKGKVPDIEIDRAIARKINYLANPSIHTFKCEYKEGKR